MAFKKHDWYDYKPSNKGGIVADIFLYDRDGHKKLDFFRCGSEGDSFKKIIEILTSKYGFKLKNKQEENIQEEINFLKKNIAWS